MTGIKATHLKRGELLFSKGHPAEVMYFVLSGDIQIIEENKINTLSTGAVIGAVEFLNNRRLHYSARCVSDVMLLVLDEKLTIELFRRQPQIGYNILKAVAAEIPSNETEAPVQEETEEKVESNGETESITENIPVTLRQLLPEGHPTFDLRASSAH
ncbi:MAG: cyclic nucleotide-binding domain-containing protein, partial [Firmicutes bacterium]|nr:cyclic nucleotide-binding domain-containing protein [Bacillota bacterium]